MVTDEEILEAVATVRAERRPPTSEAVAKQLGVDDVAELEAALARLARAGRLWMTAWWWSESEHEPTQWSYWPRLSDDATDDLRG
jgi:hypothetical protein